MLKAVKNPQMFKKTATLSKSLFPYHNKSCLTYIFSSVINKSFLQASLLFPIAQGNSPCGCRSDLKILTCGHLEKLASPFI